jgi:hypothetical protein
MSNDLFNTQRRTSLFDTVAAPESVVRSTALTDVRRAYANIFTHVHDAACYGTLEYTADLLCGYRASR